MEGMEYNYYHETKRNSRLVKAEDDDNDNGDDHEVEVTHIWFLW